jgi:DNA-binding transcriptional regulator YbjK
MGEASRRDALTDAGITTLAREGSRGLTHRAVDRAAGVAEGSTSYYFRTREALLGALVERLAELDTAVLPQLPATGAETFADGLTDLIEQMLTSGRDRLLARYELTLEATRRPELRESLDTGTRAIEQLLADRLDALGAPDPTGRAADLLALLDGLLLPRVATRPDRTTTRPALRATVGRMVDSVTATGDHPATPGRRRGARPPTPPR